MRGELLRRTGEGHREAKTRALSGAPHEPAVRAAHDVDGRLSAAQGYEAPPLPTESCNYLAVCT